MSRGTGPPGRALLLLRWTLPARFQESILGDLEEEWQEQLKLAPGRAWAWFWFQTLGLVARFLGESFVSKLSLSSRRDWRQSSHPQQGDGFMEGLWNDVRFATRMLGRSPGVAAVSVLTLALGIGANAAIFSVVNALLLKPLPLPDSNELITLVGHSIEGRRQWISYSDFLDLQRQSKLLSAMSAFVPQSVNLTGREEPTRVRGGFVSAGFFEVVAVEPSQGRGFRPGEDLPGAERVCVLQHESWRSLFGGDPVILGKTLILNNEPFTVVGVMPQGFRFPFDEIEVWMPFQHWPVFAQNQNYKNRGTGLVGPIARLKKGVTPEEARAELETIAAQLARHYPEAGEGRGVAVQRLQEVVVSDLRQSVLVMLGVVVFVLLIACANVANLLLSRAAARQKEIAMRAALGAGRARLVRQLLTETCLVWLIGGAFGLIAGRWGIDALLASAPGDLPGGITVRLDLTVLTYTFGVTILTGILFGLIPALRYSKPNLVEFFKEGGRAGAEGAQRTGVRSALVVSQVALTMVLLVGSGLMIRSFRQLTRVETGFKVEKLLTMEYRLPRNKYPEGKQQWEFHRLVAERVRAVSGVRSASLIRALPFSGNGGSLAFELPGRPKPAAGQAPRAQINTADTKYFETMGIPLLRGRVFSAQDHAESPPVVVINREMAERYWSQRDPVGQPILLADDPPVKATIIGVVANIKHDYLAESNLPQIYAAQAQNPHIFNTLVVRTEGDPMSMTPSVRAALWSVDKDQPVWKIRTVEYLIETSVGQQRFIMQLLTVYAGLALVLAAVGIYGVMSFAVTQRTSEIGVRMALGAHRGHVLVLVLRQGLLLTGIGLGIGLLGAVGLTRVMRSLLFRVSTADPLTFLVVALLLGAVALLAIYIPARRATRMDPMAALRYE